MTFYAWFKGWWARQDKGDLLPSSVGIFSRYAARAYGEHLMQPSPCGVEGHRMMDWVENPDPLSHLDSFYRSQIEKGMFNDYQVDSLKRLNICLACEREKAHSLRVAEAVLNASAEYVQSRLQPLMSTGGIHMLIGSQALEKEIRDLRSRLPEIVERVRKAGAAK